MPESTDKLGDLEKPPGLIEPDLSGVLGAKVRAGGLVSRAAAIVMERNNIENSDLKRQEYKE
jgi:hypothetical protein